MMMAANPNFQRLPQYYAPTPPPMMAPPQPQKSNTAFAVIGALLFLLFVGGGFLWFQSSKDDTKKTEDTTQDDALKEKEDELRRKEEELRKKQEELDKSTTPTTPTETPTTPPAPTTPTETPTETPTTPPAPTTPPVEVPIKTPNLEEKKRIVNGYGKCLDTVDSSQGSQLVVRTCDYNKASQEWELDATKTKLYNPNTKMYADVFQNKLVNGSAVVQWAETSGDNQVFLSLGNGQWQGKQSNRCLDTAGNRDGDRNVQIWDCQNNNNGQLFRFAKIQSDNTVKVATETLPLKKRRLQNGYGKCLDTVGSSDASRMVVRTCDASKDSQEWVINYETQKIYNPKMNKYADVYEHKTANGSAVVQYKPVNADNQIFFAHGTHQWKGKHSGRCLDTEGNVDGDRNVQIWDCQNNNKGQQFKAIEM